MGIWDELYADLVKSELKAESGSYDNQFMTVESKVEELRRRVGLSAVDLSKEAGLNKQASQSFRLVLAAEDVVAAPPTQEEEDALMAMKAYIMQLVDQRRAGIDVAVAISDLRDKFGDYSELINSNRHLLEEFFHKNQEKYLSARQTPHPMPNTIKIDEAEDNGTFENIVNKLKM